MTWLFVGLAVLVLGLIIYFISPFFIKLFKARKEKTSKKPKKDKSLEKQIKKEEKEQKALEKKQDKKAEQGVIVEAGADFFEDPDTKVNYENFDVGGLFENDETPSFNSNNLFVDDDEDFAQNINDLYDKYFTNDIRPSARSFNPSEMLENSTDDDLNEFLEQMNSQNGDPNTISEDFKKLSPEMKALLISNFLDRKDI